MCCRLSCSASIVINDSCFKAKFTARKKTVRSALANYVTLGQHSFLSVENAEFLSLAQTLIDTGASRGVIRAEDVMAKRQSIRSRILDKVTTSKASLKVLIV